MGKSDSLPGRDQRAVIEDLSERPADGGTAVADLSGLARQAELDRLMERDFEEAAPADGPTLVKPLAVGAAAAKSQIKQADRAEAPVDPAYDDLEASLLRRSWWVTPVVVGLVAGAVVIAIWLSFS